MNFLITDKCSKHTIVPNLLAEIILRILFLMGVIATHTSCQRQPICITPEELISDYKKPRRDSIVPPWVMLSIIIYVPLVILCLPIVLLRNYVESIQALLAWTLAVIINAFITEVLKIIISRPRPDFFYRCFPNGIVAECTGGIKDIVDGRKSFPSGHSSFSFCSLGFLSIWLYGRFLGRYSGNIQCAMFCSMPVFLASFIGYSRCCDNHHHWEDVIAGAVIGLITAFQCYKAYCVPAGGITMEERNE
ncbi:unnamed protein product [Pieris macdunnoughi]|uniref:Phosphatidic acid phosphatase type 2/haloperoxidase domain-containing protein n=1 Tax=Pieris macdunnoughi TaxID=345717 RepID=A0A821LIB5_9NEOP|nr:unnamed protein product [Pieris macdunnoughi]